jgi:hypothetical protein
VEAVAKMSRAAKHSAARAAGRARYDELLALQGGHCALCPSLGGKILLNVDHDWRTYEVRGLLCPGCNRKLPEYVTPDWVRRAADYLENPPARALEPPIGG